ncbi:hypothetical protein LV79_003819 [Actinokineospora globicatena]|nr:hypothetical protein [Actinokineospora globicatena]
MITLTDATPEPIPATAAPTPATGDTWLSAAALGVGTVALGLAVGTLLLLRRGRCVGGGRAIRCIGGVLSLVVAVAENPAACAAIGVDAFLNRHKGRRVRIDEDGIAVAENYSARDIERIIAELGGKDE